MKETTIKTQAMLAGNHQINPGAMVVVDIDPPFVGVEFNQSGAYPSLHEHNDVLYMVFVDGDYIKIAILDRATYKVTSLFRQFTAIDATRPKIAFEPSTYEGYVDLPTIVYEMPDGKIYARREQYDENINIVIVYDEIAEGSSIEIISVNGTINYFYVGNDGLIYNRPHGEYASVFITPEEGETATGFWVTAVPDGRLMFVYTVVTDDGYSRIYQAFSNLLNALYFEDIGAELTGSLVEIEYRRAVYYFDDSNKLTGNLEGAEFVDPVQYYDLNILNSSTALLDFIKPYLFYDLQQIASNAVSFSFHYPYYFDDSSELTASLQAFELATD